VIFYDQGFSEGRESNRSQGKPVEVTEVVDNAFVKVKLAKGKERKMNVKHLMPA